MSEPASEPIFDIPPDQYSAQSLFLDPPSGTKGVWDVCNGNSTYGYDSGLLMIPVADGDPVFVRTHAPIMTRSVSFSEMKTAGYPKVPHPTSGIGSNDVFLSGSVTPQIPKLTGNGIAKTYSIGGEYVYGMVTPLEFGTHDIPTGKHPMDISEGTNHAYPADQFAEMTDWTDEYVSVGESIGGISDDASESSSDLIDGIGGGDLLSGL